MPKNVNGALNSKAKAKAKEKAWIFKAKEKAWIFKAKAIATEVINLAPRCFEAKAWPRGLHHCSYLVNSVS